MPKQAPVDAESGRGKKGLQEARREASGSLEDTKVFPLLKKQNQKVWWRKFCVPKQVPTAPEQLS